MQVCLATNFLLWNRTLGGHAWVFLNWALGLQDAGVRVVVLEKMRWEDDPARVVAHVSRFREELAALGLRVDVALRESREQAERLAAVRPALATCLVPEDRVYEESDLLLDFNYGLPQQIVDRFRRSALVDIDPGLLQHWIAAGDLKPARHDLYFTIGETVGRPGSKVPLCPGPEGLALQWHYTPPPVHLSSWVPAATDPAAVFTTVTNWWGEYELIRGRNVNNEKRTNFIANLGLPALTRARLELAIHHEPGHPSDMPMLIEHGWRARAAAEVSATPQDYRAYIQGSRGEFSCAKQSCMELANAWISDRTLCYLASGKPAVVQHTGPSRFLPDRRGLWRFETTAEAAAMLDHLCDPVNYAEEQQAARALAEEHFDARRVMAAVLAIAVASRRQRRRTATGPAAGGAHG